MKRLAGIFLVIVMMCSLFKPHVAHASDDISGHYFEGAIRTLIDKDIMGGYGDGVFRPNGNVTRAEFTAFLVRALKLNQVGQPGDFADVKKGAWYYAGVKIASSHNLIGGYTDGTFKPNNKISRQEMAAMMIRALNSQGIVGLEGNFQYEDEALINKMFLPAIKQLKFLEVISGKEKHNKVYFAPRDDTKRGETAAILARMLDIMSHPKVVTSHTHYDYNFSHMLNKQMSGTPKLDGSGRYTASQAELHYYVNPNNFKPGSSHYMQFLQLSHSTGLHADLLNKHFLKGMGNLEGAGASFVAAGKALSINEIYLIAHTLHETGNGKSKLAQGIEVGLDHNHRAVMVTESNRKSLRNIKVAYNMYGIAAYDNSALKSGSEYAYSREWFTPVEAIVGGAEFIDRYIERGQDTLYKMKWNPVSPGYPQYATHVQWATIQAQKIHDMYSILDSYMIKFDVPRFNDQVGPSAKPNGIHRYHVNKRWAGEVGQTTDSVNLRAGPTTRFDSYRILPKETALTVIGDNGGWYQVQVGSDKGWISGEYLQLDKDNKLSIASMFQAEDDAHADLASETELTTIEAEVGGLEFRATPELTDNMIHILGIGTEITIIEALDGWMKVKVGEEIGFIEAQHLGLE